MTGYGTDIETIVVMELQRPVLSVLITGIP